MWKLRRDLLSLFWNVSKQNKKDFNDLLLEDLTGEIIKERFAKAQHRNEIDWEPPDENQEDEVEDDKDGRYPEKTLAIVEAVAPSF